MDLSFLNEPVVKEAIVRSLWLSLAVSGFSGLFGCVMAWIASRTDVAGKGALATLLSIPYAIPAYLLGMAWIVLGNPAVGILRGVFPSQGIYGFWGMVLVETTVAFAFPYLELRAGFDRLDPSLEEAARMSGAPPWRVFRDVSLPLLWPPLLNGMSLAFLYTLSSFGVPAMLGMPVREFVLTTLIYSQFKLGGFQGLMTGFKLAALLLVIALAVLVFSNRLMHAYRKRAGAFLAARSSRPSLVLLGRARIPLSAISWALVGVMLALPWCALALSALAPVAGTYAPSAWTLRNLGYVISLPDFREALVNSLTLAGAVSALLVFAGFLVAYAAVRRGSRAARWCIESLGAGFAAPGTVIALIIIIVSARVSVSLGDYGFMADMPLVWMGIAYAVKYGALGSRMLAASFRQVHPALEESARVCGAGTARVLADIWAPILKKTIAAALFLSALPMFTELTMSVLLTGPGAATLGTVLFQLQEYADQPSAAALAWMILTAALAVALAARGGKTVDILEERS
ncbi:MAG: iron ABC transporter permease [Spirochaetes bacterium]|nr:MAG: iron ABC transporter permease [Spirochaetota bacterium]